MPKFHGSGKGSAIGKRYGAFVEHYGHMDVKYFTRSSRIDDLGAMIF
jgi:hypothetical protein